MASCLSGLRLFYEDLSNLSCGQRPCPQHAFKETVACVIIIAVIYLLFTSVLNLVSATGQWLLYIYLLREIGFNLS